MTRLSLALAALLLLALGLAPAVHAQESMTPRRVVLVDGTVLVGSIVDETADPIVLINSNGVEQRIPRDRVLEITDLLDGRFTRYDPARTRLFFSPTARPLGAGNKRFSAYYVFPSLAYGVTNRVDVSAGATIPFVSTASESLFVLLNGNVKATLTESDGFSTAVGGSVLVPLATGEDIPGVGGTFYGLATIGGDAGAVTLGAFGVYATDFADAEIGNGAAILIGLEKQLSDRFKLVSENYLILPFGDTADGTAFGSLSGVRFFGDRLAADIAVAVGAADGEISSVPIPYLGLSYTF